MTSAPPARPHPSSRARRIYDLVRAQIRSGELGPDELLVEHRLLSTFGIGRADVRTALRRLAEEGLVTREPRVGTRVAHAHHHVPVDRVVPVDPVPGTVVRVLHAGLTRGTDVVRARLGIADPEVGLVERVCESPTADGVPEPLSVGTAYCRAEHLDALWSTDYQSFEEGFDRIYGLPLGDVETVVSAESADPLTARQLRISPGDAVLSREQVLRGVDGVAYQYVFSHFRADRVSFPVPRTP